MMHKSDKPPCTNCEKRFPACHDTCEPFNVWKEGIRAINENMKLEKEIRGFYHEHAKRYDKAERHGGFRKWRFQEMNEQEFKEFVNSRHYNYYKWEEGAVGLASEAGEVLQVVRKNKFDCQPLNDGELALELSDVLHYTMLLTDHLGLTLEDLYTLNVEKLNHRDAGASMVFEMYMRDWDAEHQSLGDALEFAKKAALSF